MDCFRDAAGKYVERQRKKAPECGFGLAVLRRGDVWSWDGQMVQREWRKRVDAWSLATERWVCLWRVDVTI